MSESGIPIPKGKIACTPIEAGDAAVAIGASVIKAQTKSGGRGKAGLIIRANTPQEAEKAAEAIFSSVHNGEQVKKVLVEEQLNIVQELYTCVSLDCIKGNPVILCSVQGGVKIEEAAEASPSIIMRRDLDPLECVVPIDIIMGIWQNVGLKGKILHRASSITFEILRLFHEIDALLVEINPLVITSEGIVIAADSRIIVDDASIFRQNDLQRFKETTCHSLEAEGSKIGVSFVEINHEGNIGVISGGAGLGMATMDIIVEYGGIPAAFLDLGGGISSEGMTESLKIMLKVSGLKGVIINVFGGINNCEIMAIGIAKAFVEVKPSVAILVKMRGHSQEEGWEILEKLQIPLVKHGTTSEAIGLLMDIVN